MSTPTLNSAIPKINISAPKQNITVSPELNGAIVTLNSSTTAVIGSTDASDSRIFSPNGFSHLCRISQPHFLYKLENQWTTIYDNMPIPKKSSHKC